MPLFVQQREPLTTVQDFVAIKTRAAVYVLIDKNHPVSLSGDAHFCHFLYFSSVCIDYVGLFGVILAAHPEGHLAVVQFVRTTSHEELRPYKICPKIQCSTKFSKR